VVSNFKPRLSSSPIIENVSSPLTAVSVIQAFRPLSLNRGAETTINAHSRAPGAQTAPEQSHWPARPFSVEMAGLLKRLLNVTLEVFCFSASEQPCVCSVDPFISCADQALPRIGRDNAFPCRWTRSSFKLRRIVGHISHFQGFASQRKKSRCIASTRRALEVSGSSPGPVVLGEQTGSRLGL
jgi:hypothetical protein